MTAARSNILHFGAAVVNPPLDACLSASGEAEALRLFRKGLDTVDIAWRLECTLAAAANGLAAARDRVRMGRA